VVLTATPDQLRRFIKLLDDSARINLSWLENWLAGRNQRTVLSSTEPQETTPGAVLDYLEGIAELARIYGVRK